MRITISGEAGSGKSTVAKMLAHELGYRYYSVGVLLRKMAQRRGMSIMEISSLAEKDSRIDTELDDEQKKSGSRDNFVMDSRLGFLFIPQSYKVFLRSDIDKAAERIFGDERNQEKYKSVEEAKEHIRMRMASEQKRYRKYYGIEFPRLADFDCIIDTTDMTPPEIAKGILRRIGKGKGSRISSGTKAKK